MHSRFPGRRAAPRVALRPLAALIAGLGVSGAFAADDTPAASTPAPASETVMPAVRAKATAEPSGKETLRPQTTSIGKGRQELRDVPQSITIVTEKLIDDRQLDTLKEALKNTSGISFQAAEGGEEDIRLRGFSLQSTGDIFIDGMRDPAFYERDSFNWDRLEVLRGSASMLFGRGSTGGAVNQVSKQPWLMNQHEVSVTMGSGGYLRGTGDFSFKTGADEGLRVTAMHTLADDVGGAPIDKHGLAATYRWGTGRADEFTAGLFYLHNENGINYGLPWLTPGARNGGTWLWPEDRGRNYYGMASDVAVSGTSQGNFTHLHRFGGGAELKTAVRVAKYERDQRASAIRFLCVRNAQNVLPAGCADAVTGDNFSDATVLRRSGDTGVQLKTMNMDTVYAQSDYSGRHRWWGREHSVQAGVDLAHEKFDGFAVAPSSPVLNKPRTTVGTPDDGASIDESARVLTRNRTFDAKALGVYAQDMVQLAPMWKVLGGLRWDRFEGQYWTAATSTQAEANRGRTDSLWSRRFGVLYQPTDLASFHLSYGTSFNTSGDTYQYDAGSVKADPEKSRNVELGAKLDSANGRLSTRFAIFHATKYNERNRDDTSAGPTNYVLSGKRHAAGLEVDLAGRITPAWEAYVSYAWIPDAKVDQGTPQALMQNGEAVGARPGLTPRHTGTLWTTYQLDANWRIGGGLNARSSDRPVGLAAGSQIVAPKYVTGDLMAEYTQGDLSYKVYLANVTDEYYADFLYRGHYIPGKPRTLQVTASYRFN